MAIWIQPRSGGFCKYHYYYTSQRVRYESDRPLLSETLELMYVKKVTKMREDLVQYFYILYDRDIHRTIVYLSRYKNILLDTNMFEL